MKKKHEIQRLTIEQIKQVLETAQEPSIKALLTLAITTGLRRGELLGLCWQDLDEENQCLHVRRIVSGSGDKEAKETARTIVVPAIALQAIEDHRHNQEKEEVERSEVWQDLGLMFPAASGQRIDPKTFQRQYHGIFDAIGLPHMQFHDLRHCTAACLVEIGIGIAVIHALLGYRYRSTSIRTLMPVSLSMQKEAMQKWDELLKEEGSRLERAF